MAVQSCLLLIETSWTTRPSAHVIAIPDDRSAQAFVEIIRSKLTGNTNKTKRFFNTYVLFHKPTVSIATLRSIEVHDLTALPTCKALVQNASLDEALTEAIGDPELTDWAFYTHMFALYENVFVEIDQHVDHIILPRQALLIQHQISPRVKRVIGGVASILGGLIVMTIKLREGN